MVEMFAISTRACGSILYCGVSTLTPSKDYYLAGEEREREMEHGLVERDMLCI